MFDGIRAINRNPGECSRLLTNINLDFDEIRNIKTGQVKYYEAKYKGLILNCSQWGAILRGSLHKFYNEDKHNYDDYYLEDLANTLEENKIRLKY